MRFCDKLANGKKTRVGIPFGEISNARTLPNQRSL